MQLVCFCRIVYWQYCKTYHNLIMLAFQEPSLFAVAKLLETGYVNMSRIEVLWRPVTNHLLEVCHHPHIRMREWGVEAITYLVKAALQYKYQVPLRENQVIIIIQSFTFRILSQIF